MTILGQKFKSDHFGKEKKKKYLKWKVQKMTILGKNKKKKKKGRLRDCHKSEKVNILGEKKRKKSSWSGWSKK